MSAPHDGRAIGEVLAGIRAALAAAGIDSPGEARILLAAALDIEPKAVALAELTGEPVPQAALQRLAGLMGRRTAREPLQHITGRAPFRRSELAVGPGVFIPRPETELLAGWGIDFLRSRPLDARCAVDLCTGSGAVARSLAAEVSRAKVMGVELDATACGYAERNARAARADLERTGSSLTVVCADALVWRPAAPVDLVIANPPYVDAGRQPDIPEVEADPALALYGGGADGLDFPRRLIAHAAQFVCPGGALAVEHAEYQSAHIAAAFAEHGLKDIAVHRDYTGRERFTTGLRAPSEEDHGAAL